MSPEENITTITLEPIKITGTECQEISTTFDIDPQHAEALQSHIQEAPEGKAINLCL